MSTPMPFIRRALLAALAVPACIPSIVVGDSPQDETDGTTATSLTTTTEAPTTDEAPTTGGTAPLPSVCGDGLVGPGEICDDGNDEPNDGCDAACTRTGRVDWHVEPEGVHGVADMVVAATGRILVSCWDGDESLLLTLAPDGAELARQVVPISGEMALAADGRLYIGSIEGQLHAFSPTGQPLWHFEATLPADVNDGIVGLTILDDALYAASNEAGAALTGYRVALRRHDLASGAVAWETRTPDDVDAFGEALAVLGEDLVVVGHVTNNGKPLFAEFTRDGELLGSEREGVVRPWTAAVTAAGEIVMAGFGPELPAFAVSRLAPDQSELFTIQEADTPGSMPLDIAVGPGQQIAAVGWDISDSSAVVRTLDSGGASVWTSVFSPLVEHEDCAVAAAYGPDFLAVAGHERPEIEGQGAVRMWVRRFALD